MLEMMYDLLEARSADRLLAWDRLVELLAVDNCGPLMFHMNNGFEWLLDDQMLASDVLEIYDRELLRSDFHDHLGDMYLEKIVSGSSGKKADIFYTPANVASLLAEMTIGNGRKQLRVIDPAVGTGRLLMAAYQRSPHSVLFGVDTDLRALRIALTNFAIHNIQGYLLHADSLRHEIDISTPAGRDNWRYANRWQSQMHKLQPIGRDPQTELRLTRGQKRQTED